MLVFCVAGLTAVALQVRCIDAAREAARLAARGDDATRNGLAPDGATVQMRRDGELVIARVATRSALLPGIVVAAEAVAAVEPGLR